MSKYTVMITQNYDAKGSVKLKEENVVAFMEGDMLSIGVATKDNKTNVIYTQPLIIGNYEDLARVHLTVGEALVRKFREQNDLPNYIEEKK